jgi:hypothetical protein
MDGMNIATIPIAKSVDGDAGVIVIRALPTGVALCLSAEEDGDVELVLRREELSALVLALQSAVGGLP